MTNALRLSMLLLLGGASLLGGCASAPQNGIVAARTLPEGTTGEGRALYLNLIEDLIAGGKPYAALAHLEEYERLNRREPATLKLAGDAWMAAGRPDEAEMAYSGIVSGPLRAFGEHGLGRVMAARADWPAARVHFAKAAQAEPTDPVFLSDLGYSEMKTGDFSSAELSLRKAYELAPEAASVEDRLLLLLIATNRAEEIGTVFGAGAGSEKLHRLVMRRDVLMHAPAQPTSAQPMPRSGPDGEI